MSLIVLGLDHSSDDGIYGLELSPTLRYIQELLEANGIPDFVVLPKMVGLIIHIHNGKSFMPVEIIPEMINKWQEGVDIVYAKRKKRDDSLFKRLTAYCFYRFLNFLSDIPIPTDVGDYRLQDKQVNNFLKLNI